MNVAQIGNKYIFSIEENELTYRGEYTPVCNRIEHFISLFPNIVAESVLFGRYKLRAAPNSLLAAIDLGMSLRVDVLMNMVQDNVPQIIQKLHRRIHELEQCMKKVNIPKQYDTKEQRLVKAGEIWKKFITIIGNEHVKLVDSIMQRESVYPGAKATQDAVNTWFAGKVSDVQDGIGESFRLALITLATPPIDARFNGYEDTVVPACGYVPSVYREFIMTYLIDSRVKYIRGITEQDAATKLEPFVRI